jgi:hypothetical protein
MTAAHLVPDNSKRPGGSAWLAGREVARIGFGAMQLERAEDPASATAVLRHAIDSGVNHIDTAHFYGEVNTLIRNALTPYADDLALVTKVGAVRDNSNKLIAAQKPHELREQVEANLSALGTDHIAVVNIRRVDAPPGIIAEGDQKVDLDCQLAELTDLKNEGKIGGIGLSNVDEEQLASALPAGIACVQNIYSLLDRSAQPVLDLCRAHGIAWVPYAPLGSVFPGYPKVTEDPAVIEAAARVNVTPAQAGLAWLLAHYDQTLLIPGTSSLAHLAENIAAGDVRLSAEVAAVLDNVTGAA